MKLFSKKKEEPKPELPPLKFPEFPQESNVPSYNEESEAESIKQAVEPSLDIPIRKPMGRSSPISPPPQEEIYNNEPIDKTEAPSYQEPTTPGIQKRGQTLFVQIERYREAVTKMEHIKEKLAEAEKILSRLDDMKRKEDEELQKWHQDLESLRNKILSVDKNLFEE